MDNGQLFSVYPSLSIVNCQLSIAKSKILLCTLKIEQQIDFFSVTDLEVKSIPNSEYECSLSERAFRIPNLISSP